MIFKINKFCIEIIKRHLFWNENFTLQRQLIWNQWSIFFLVITLVTYLSALSSSIGYKNIRVQYHWLNVKFISLGESQYDTNVYKTYNNSCVLFWKFFWEMLNFGIFLVKIWSFLVKKCQNFFQIFVPYSYPANEYHTWARGRTVRTNPRRKLAKLEGGTSQIGKN